MKKIYGLIVLAFSLSVNAQTIQSKIYVPYNNYGGTRPALLFKPDNYATASSTKFPLLIFLHGAGQGSSNSTLADIYNDPEVGGPAYFIEHGQWPSYFSNPTDGQQYKFLVLSPHAVGSGWSTSGPELDLMLKHMVANYRVDINRIYLTGLSAGGSGVVQYIAEISWDESPAASTYNIAAAVPMSQAMGAKQSWANTIASNNVRTWGFGDPNNDLHGSNTLKLINYINNAKSGWARFTSYSGGHCCFNQFYNPSYRQTIEGKSMNIYEWMLQYKQGSTSPTPVNQAPVANAGSDKTITLPTNSVSLNGSGSDADGTIASYSWVKTSGPSQYSFNNPNIATPIVSNLVSGTYTFRLTVTDDDGASSSDLVNVIVNSNTSGSTAKPVPGKIEAELYNNMSGIQTENTSDVGGGKNVGWIDRNDWMDYYVNVASTGSYNIEFRVASVVATGQLQLRLSNGTILSTLSIPNTGAWQNWVTISAVVNLTAGNQTLRIFAENGGWNLNWINFIASSSTPPPSSSGQTKYINVNVYDGITPYYSSLWNNWNVYLDSSTKSSFEFKYSTGSNSGVRAIMSYSEHIADNGTVQNGMVPGAVLRLTSYASKSRTLTLSGLNPSYVYNIELYACRTINPNNETNYTANNASATVYTYNNFNNKAILAGLKPNAQGIVVITITPLNTYSYLNGFKIIENPDALANTQNSTNANQNNLSQASTESNNQESKVEITPQQFKDRVVININNQVKGTLSIQFVDMNGKIIKEMQMEKTDPNTQLYISTDDLHPGQYELVLKCLDWQEKTKIVKQ